MRTLLVSLIAVAAYAQSGMPGQRVWVDAHNCYPENGQWANRIERALQGGLPVAIEQDLAWYVDAQGHGRSVLSHEKKPHGTEPGMREHFFERVRPLITSELKTGNPARWPVLVLNLDFKTNEPEHHRAVWALLQEYKAWLTTAPKSADGRPRPLKPGPILVLTGDSDEQERTFHDAVPPGGNLLLFGAVKVAPGSNHLTPPAEMIRPGSNYRRWWNNPWMMVEKGGPRGAADWTPEDAQRLQALVDYAHQQNLWIRFYTLNGHPPEASEGWGAAYNFGSREAAAVRWRAAQKAGVDFIATDHYGALREALR
jgi:hypothetical protein